MLMRAAPFTGTTSSASIRPRTSIREIGKFVCAGAGHHLEAVLAANGSGTVSRSQRDRQTLLNVDIGGGTTKLALVHDGAVVATAAVAVGARALVKDAARRLTRIDES